MTTRGDPAGTKYDPEFKRATRPPSEMLELIPRYAISKHGTHTWTGRRWKKL